MTESQEPAVRVTLDAIYQEVKNLRTDMAPLAPLIERVADHEVRIRRLEAWKYALPATLFTAIGAAVIALF